MWCSTDLLFWRGGRALWCNSCSGGDGDGVMVEAEVEAKVMVAIECSR